MYLKVKNNVLCIIPIICMLLCLTISRTEYYNFASTTYTCTQINVLKYCHVCSQIL